MIRPASSALFLLVLGACASVAPPAPEAVRPNPNAAALIAAGDASREQGRFAEALQIYNDVLAGSPSDGAAQYGIGESLLGLGRAGEARAVFEALAQEPEFHARALQGEGLAQLATGQREQAGQLLAEAIGADAGLWRSWNALGMLADLRRDWSGAEAAYATALALNPNSALLLNNLGYSRLLAGKPAQALQTLKKAIAIDPGSEKIQNNIRLALAAQGNYREAMRGVPKENMGVALNNIGYVAMQRGDLAAAEAYFSRAMESSPSFHTVASKNIEALKALKGDE